MRLHLVLALVTALLLVLTLRPNERHRFTFAHVQELAEKKAAEKYVAPGNALPPQLAALTPEQEQGIFWKDAYRLWRDKGLPFQVDFYHVSRSFPTGPNVRTVDGRGVHLLAYSPLFFNFLNLSFNPPLPATLPYAGFYLRYPINKPDSLDGFFSVLGASYFRALAKDQVYGLTARGLAVNSGIDGQSEEFPAFTDWWLQQPAPHATEMVLDALLDSPSVTGAYEFRIHPGAPTSVDVHETLFLRQAVKRIGIAPFSSMYLYGENAPDHFGDNVHPEIHDSDGALLNTGKGEWIWRPLQQTAFLQDYLFLDDNPKGFGLLQRDRDFEHYQDLEKKYNVRPSAWVTPHGNWGKGAVELIQSASNTMNTDNVVLFWRPDPLPKAGDRLDFDYTLDFYMNDAARPPLAFNTATLINTLPAVAGVPNPGGTVPVQFLVDFAGGGIEDVSPASPPRLDLICDPPATLIRDVHVDKNGYDKSWRVTFTLVPLKHNQPTELHCRLMHGDTPLTETWTYTWHQ